MKALRFENNKLDLAEIEKPQRSGEAIVRVLKSGICNTDLEIVRGYAGFSGNNRTRICRRGRRSGRRADIWSAKELSAR